MFESRWHRYDRVEYAENDPTLPFLRLGSTDGTGQEYDVEDKGGKEYSEHDNQTDPSIFIILR